MKKILDFLQKSSIFSTKVAFARSLFYFLGSYYFALILIALLALIVALGTLIESIFDSHLYAARLTYSNPIFNLLLGCVFINILVSTLTRWPFKFKHIPFLITHCGLLMLIAGVIVKNFYGVQGSMALAEGTGSDEILIPDTYAIYVEKNSLKIDGKFESQEYILAENKTIIPQSGNLDLKLEVLDHSSNSIEHLSSWIKGNFCYVSGLSPFPVVTVQVLDQKEIPISSRVKLFKNSSEVWDIYALKTDDIIGIVKKIFYQGASIETYQLEDFSFISSRFLNDQDPLQLEIGDDFSLTSAKLNVDDITFQLLAKEMFAADLKIQGNKILNIKTIPKLIFIQNSEKETFLVAIDRYGYMHFDYFPASQQRSMIVYDRGFGGYYAHTQLPFFSYHYGPIEIYQAKMHQLAIALQKAIESNKVFSPPLQLLYELAKSASLEFPEVAVLFFHSMNNPMPRYAAELVKQMQSYQITLENLLPKFENLEQGMTCLRDYRLSQKIRNKMIEALPILIDQPRKQWINTLENLPNTSPLLKEIAEYLHPSQDVVAVKLIETIKEMLPYTFFTRHPVDDVLEEKNVTLEVALSPEIVASIPQKKLELNTPKVTLKVSDSKQRQEIITLAYDRFAAGMAWPIFNGDYRLRFQPKYLKIPYHIRLHQARQLNYPNSNQPFSYESDLIVKHVGASPEFVTVSMNHVYEGTKHPYRFYLSNISAVGQATIQKIQLIVNYDPVKYILTYPGAILVVIGIALLFWFRIALGKIKNLSFGLIS